MRRLNLMILIVGVAILFFGCSKTNSLAPDNSQSDQETSFLKKAKIAFTGTSILIAPGDPGTTTVLPNGNIMIKGQTAVWYDSAYYENNDLCWEVTGITNWTVNWLITGENTAKLWGKCEILVGTHPDHPDWAPIGKWELSWHGWQTPTPEGFKIVCDANGTGKEGDVKGMVGKWIFTMDSEVGFFYSTEGYIK